MKELGFILVGDRRFPVEAATIDLVGDGQWHVEITGEKAVYDRENWRPCLYHQGLDMGEGVNALSQLSGLSTSWRNPSDLDYPHPEIGLLYVFGHHETYECELRFGEVRENRIAVSWAGKCDVFRDKTYGEGLPLTCECWATMAIDSAIDPQLLQVFFSEIEERTAGLEGETDLAHVRKRIHSVLGASALVECDGIVELAQDALSRMANATSVDEHVTARVSEFLDRLQEQKLALLARAAARPRETAAPAPRQAKAMAGRPWWKFWQR